MSYGNVKTRHAVWIGRLHTCARVLPKLLILGLGAGMVAAGVQYHDAGALLIGVVFMFMCLMALGMKGNLR